MNKLITKARSGVTLVELLVVILIVTILSVSMLPLLQPFVVESQYAAEAIPVIGNLRTKIGVYQYDKGKLPTYSGSAYTNVVHTWRTDATDSEKYVPCSYNPTALAAGYTATERSQAWDDDNKPYHIGMLVDVDYQDLKGKRSKPVDYQYYVISADSNPSYVIACFGNGDGGLKRGTGYAVCELNYTKYGKKYIGTWKRYKPTDDSVTLEFNTAAGIVDDAGKPVGCYIPSAADFDVEEASNDGEPALINNMRAAGWEF